MRIWHCDNKLMNSFEEYKRAFGDLYNNGDHLFSDRKLIDFHEDVMKSFFHKIEQLFGDRERNERRLADYKTTFDLLVKQQIVMERKMEIMMNEIEYLTNLEKKRENEYKHNEKMNTYMRLKKELAEIEQELKKTAPEEMK